MKEKLIDIVQSIDTCAEKRIGTRIVVVARVHCLYNGQDKTFWFTQGLVNAKRFDIPDEIGQFVPKNAPIAVKFQKNDIGSSFEYSVKNIIKKIENYHVVLENRANFENHIITIAGDDIMYQYRNIKEFLGALKKNRREIEEVENNILKLQQQKEELKKKNGNPSQIGQITKSINKYKDEYKVLTQQQEDLKNITIYIRKQGEMRYTLIVDPVQTSIKTQNLYDGKTVIIEGGPGTGKSTTMIHRLAYLTDKFAIEEDEKNGIGDFKLSSLQRKQLFQAIDTQRDWMFFSPSDMLKDYLAQAMQEEELQNTSQKVWCWKGYCRMVLKQHYGLMATNTDKAPFKDCYFTDTLFYQNSGIIEELKEFYLAQIRQLVHELPKFNKDGDIYKWTAIATNMSNRLEGCENYDISRFVSIFRSFELSYNDECKNILSENEEVINKIAKNICDLVEKYPNDKDDIIDALDLSLDESDINEDDEQDILSFNEDKSKDNSSLDKIGYNREFFKGIKKWLKAYTYSKVNNDYYLSEKFQIISDIILPMLSDKYDKQIQKMGELMLFEQYAKLSRGVIPMLLNGLPECYKKFRKHLIKTQFKGCNFKLLREIIQRNQGKELHYQEQSLLLGFINNLVKLIKANGVSNAKHKYIEAYDEISRPIIGVDEATDFCVCDIYAMQSLLTRGFNSFTLCGDMMQRLTDYGIKSWSELEGVIPNIIEVKMKTSYRQSKKLLDVAKRIYADTLDKKPNYSAFMKSNKVPEPLVFVDTNEDAKITWISKRIEEVYRAYGEQLPSIAIFVNDKGYIPAFIQRLQNTDFFKAHKIHVLDGTDHEINKGLNHICVYSIDVVKGMEFDVVFFHNIDKLSIIDTERIKRYIYVGVSRAAFFLGITMIEPIDDICKYFVKNKDWFKI